MKFQTKVNFPKYTKIGLETVVGNTPLLPLPRIGKELPPGVKLFAKAEWFNPGGSVKDRPALGIIHHAIESGELDDGRTLLDSTSGNMGISYATLAASMGIRVRLTIPANASPERMTVLNALGAEITLTDPLEGADGAILAARDIHAQDPDKYFYADQYNNPANWQAHYQSTGPEIWEQTGGTVTHFVAGLGTSGTITGTTHYLREQNPDIQSIAFQPDAPFHGLEGLKHMASSIQPGIYDPTLPNKNISVSTELAYEFTRRLAKEEGLFVGISSGAAAVAALQIAKELESGVVVTVFPDAGYKYLSNSIWEDAG